MIGRSLNIGSYKDYDNIVFFQAGHCYRIISYDCICIIRIKEIFENFPYLWKFQGISYNKKREEVIMSIDIDDCKLPSLPFGKDVTATEISPREANSIIKGCARYFKLIKEIIK